MGHAIQHKKCKVMHCGHLNPKHTYMMGGERLSSTDEERDVGVMVTASLKPSAQCAKAARIAATVLGADFENLPLP